MPGCYTGINVRRIWTIYRSRLRIITHAIELLLSRNGSFRFAFGRALYLAFLYYCVIFVIQVMCRIYGGYLAEIITATEDSFLEGYTQKMGSMYRFVGPGAPKKIIH